MITASLRTIAKALQGATNRLVRITLLLTIPLALTSGAQVITKDALKAADKQIDAAKAEQKTATKALDKAQKAAKVAAADLTAAKQLLTDLQAKLATTPADGKAKVATKIAAAKDEVGEMDAAKAKKDADVNAARQRFTNATQKVLDAETNARSLNAKYAEQKAAPVVAPAPKPAAVVAVPAKPVTPAAKPVAVVAAPAVEAQNLQAPVPGAIVTPSETPKLTGAQTPALPAEAPKPAVAAPVAAPVIVPVAKPVEPAKPAAVVAAPSPKTIAPTPAPASKPVVAKSQPKPAAKPAAAPASKAQAEPVSGPFAWGDIRPAQPAPTIAGDQKITVEPSAIPPMPAPAGPDKIQFDVAMLSGDKAIVEKLDVWRDWCEHITFNPVSVQEIQEFHTKLMKALAQEGYVFANVTFPTRVWNNGIFLAKIDGGPLGNITSVKGNRYYSASQIVKNLSRTGVDRFDYTTVYGDLFDLNAKPDLQINMKLKPIIQDGRRIMNADLEVQDKLPIHGAFEVSNTGTKQTNDWRMHSTISHLNLTKHDDVLSLDWITSPDLGDVNAWSGGYFLPIDREYSLSLFGGWSTADVNDVMPLLDVHGTGYFGGGQITKTYREDAKSRIQLSAGWLYQRFQNRHEINGDGQPDRDVAVSMPTFTIGYVSKQLDSWHGRNFFSNTVMANFGGKFGSAVDDTFNTEGTGFTDGHIVIDKFQFVRFQRLFKGDDQPGKWTLMLKVDGQIPSDQLITGLRKSFGGADSVRGYHEQEESFDEGYVANLELHTPLLQNFVPGFKKSDEFLSANPEAWQQHRLLFLVFTDYGYGRNLKPLPGELTNDSFASVGAGLRFGFTKYANLRLDYGFPLTKTEETSSSSGRAHVSFQLQF